MHAYTESRISSFVFFALDCNSYSKVELFFFKFFQNPFEKFCPSMPLGSTMWRLLVALLLFDFWAEPRFPGQFFTVGSGSRFSGHPVDRKPTLIVLHQTLPMRTTLIQFFGFRAGFKVSGRFPAIRPKFSITGSPETSP